MATAQKTAAVAEIKDRLTSSEGVILADYRGLSVKDMQELRVNVRNAGADLKIYKNTLTEIAIRELAMPSMDEYLVGPTAFVFVEADPVAPAKALADFAKTHKTLQIKGGFIENSVVGEDAVKAIAALPSREELVAKLLGTLQNPMAKTVRVLNGPASAFARALNAIAQQKEAAA